MIPRILPALVALVGLLLAACYPVDEHQTRQPKPAAKPKPTATTQTEQEKAKAQQEKLRKAAEAKKKQAEAGQPGTESPTTAEKLPEPPKRVDYEFAKKAPGKEGFVLSPYNNKIINTLDDAGKPRPRGTLMADPTYPPAEKKYFRVP
ncbi:MAG: hypothetical protein NTW21_31515 [Verrucomicrobia bacterium]|nr:hypothetical protein [Verrucomicrobiota bacterium]